jgi:hypothetical protein
LKKYLLYLIIAFLSLVLVIVLGITLTLFFKPEVFINTNNLSKILKESEVLKKYSWNDGEIKIIWNKWNDREIKIYFNNFCFTYESEGLDLESCLNEFSGDLNLSFSLGDGLSVRSTSPVVILSKKTKIVLKETPKKETVPPPDIYKYWGIAWNNYIPDLDIRFIQIELISKDSIFEFGIELKRSAHKLSIGTLNFSLVATPRDFTIRGPKEFLIPGKPLKGIPLYLREFRLHGKVSKKAIPIDLSGKFESIDFKANATLSLPITQDVTSVEFKRLFLNSFSAEVNLDNIQDAYKKYGPKSYPILPAPLNAMNGNIKTTIVTDLIHNSDSILFKTQTNFDMKGKKQFLILVIDTDVPLNLVTFKPDSVNVGIDLKKVVIELPKISKNSAPPQFAPDGRFKNTPYGGKTKAALGKKESEFDLSLHLEALNEKALHLRTNLLDEPLRLNFDLTVEKGNLKTGFVEALPLKTKVFKRPIQLESLRVSFNLPKSPVIKGSILFPLPEYRITLNLEGPVSEPRYSFSSVPPLSQNDIYAVLLFGRPLSELGTEDKNSAQKTNQILSQGILSLSVLYFLAGSPVEYVGYDPDSKNATAQIGLGGKNSLRVGGGSEGVNSTGVRRSLGKGWYIDTSAQSSSSLSDSNSRNYGVMLERIMAY